jgi:hypothetical protein
VVKKGYFLQPECTFIELGIELMVVKSLQDNTKILLMFFFILRVDQVVINEDHDKFIQLRHEYGVHQVHKMYMNIGESRQHNQILIQSIPRGEGSLRDIFQIDLDLMVTRTKIDLRKDLSTGKLLKKECQCGGQRVLVLNGDGI